MYREDDLISIKALALDVDGTITDQKRRLCPGALEAIRKVEDRGIPVIIVTGNILCSTKTISILLGTTGGLVAENGGVIEYAGEISVLGNLEKCERAFQHLRKLYDVKKVEYSSARVSEIALERSLPVKKVKEALKSWDVEVYDTQFALHLTDPAVNKGLSLLKVAKNMGINPEEIMAIGDSENDLEFLEQAGWKVAVANSDPELKIKADYVTEKPYGDGVNEAIRRFLL
ncbi:phosphoglycolate phosphatase [Methanobacterium sp. CWC-01]|uniref:phosphoglycolate phosphatase n=1 Tax=Methanobacterium aridiramus TaxID=2584467 RepID=UPI0025761F35|nr:phosphoglycolate phosphatase [Methanobacterium sp. CWC-01]